MAKPIIPNSILYILRFYTLRLNANDSQALILWTQHTYGIGSVPGRGTWVGVTQRVNISEMCAW